MFQSMVKICFSSLN